MSNQFKYTLCKSCSRWLDQCIGEEKSSCQSYCPDYCLAVYNESPLLPYFFGCDPARHRLVLYVYDESPLFTQWVAYDTDSPPGVLSIQNEVLLC